MARTHNHRSDDKDDSVTDNSGVPGNSFEEILEEVLGMDLGDFDLHTEPETPEVEPYGDNILERDPEQDN